ncbi:MAG: DsbA family protein [Pseudomonadota bacterium]
MRLKPLIAGAAATAFLGALVFGFSAARTDDTQSAEPADSASAPESAAPQDAAAEGVFNQAQEDRIGALVRAYLVANPDVLVEAFQALETRDRERKRAQLTAGARANFDKLAGGEAGFVTPARNDADVVVIEFFDYHCIYCKGAADLVRDLVKDDEDVKIVFQELPIVREESQLAAAYALAARAQDKYVDVHFALMEAKGVLDEPRLRTIVEKQGVDLKALGKPGEDKRIASALEASKGVAAEIGLTGTPAFIVASADGAYLNVIDGFNEDSILESVESARRAAKP